MKKKEVEYFYNEYNEICKKLCCDYKIRLNNLKFKYLYEGGVFERRICEELNTIFVEYQNSILQIIVIIGNEFEKSFDKKFFEKFKEVNEKNINGYFEDIKVIIKENIGMEMQESTKIRLNNLKENVKCNTIANMIKKNDSIKRILNKERKKDSFIKKMINSVIDNFVGYIFAFCTGFMTSHWKEVIEFIKVLIK